MLAQILFRLAHIIPAVLQRQAKIKKNKNMTLFQLYERNSIKIKFIKIY